MKKRLIVDGMHCENCVKGLNAVLSEDVEGVKVLDISLDGGYADVDVDDTVKDEAIKDAVEDLGFELKEIKNI